MVAKHKEGTKLHKVVEEVRNLELLVFRLENLGKVVLMCLHERDNQLFI